MDITITCNVSLSKKLRSIMGDGEGRVVFVMDSIIQGAGEGSLLISGENLNSNAAQQILEKETSIQFTPMAVKNEIPSVHSVSNIFSSGDIQKGGVRTAVDKIAATTPPEKGEASHSIKGAEEIEVPEPFPEYKNPQFRSFVSSFEELMMAVKAAQGKESEIDVDSIENPREKAVAIEAKEKAEAIDMAAYVVNDTCKSVTINDLDISLGLNIPFDLSNISAKRVAASGDLKAMIRANVIKFIKPEEVVKYMKKTQSEEIEKYGLEAYGSAEEAERAIGQIPEAEQIDIKVNDSSPNEQEQLSGLVNLTGSPSSSNGITITSHGEGSYSQKRMDNNISSVNPQALKTIARK